MYPRGDPPPERETRVMPPEGQPLHDDLPLVEDALVGWSYRLFHTGYDEDSFSGHLATWVSLVSSLGAGAVFLLGFALWRRRSGALVAALIAAFAVALAAWHLTGFLLALTAVLLAAYLVWRREWRSVGLTAAVLGGVALVVGLTVPALRVKGLVLSPGACLLYLTALLCLVPPLRRALAPRGGGGAL